MAAPGEVGYAAWPEDDFNDGVIDPNKWNILYTPHCTNAGAIEEKNGSLHVAVYQRDECELAQVYAESVEAETDEPWTYYAAVYFGASANNWSSVHVGFYFVMEDGSAAFLRFDSVGCSTCRMTFGSATTAVGPNLWCNRWYELKVSWDSVELRAWYREKGRRAWLGGFAIYSSFSTYPETLRIGQACYGCSAGTWQDLDMHLYVDYWTRTEPEPLPEAPADDVMYEDEFGYSQIDTTKWSKYVMNYGSNTGDLKVDGYGHLYAGLYTRDETRAAAGVWAETARRIPDELWEYYTKMKFYASQCRSDVDLGLNFEMANGTEYAFAQFDSYSYCRLKYGTNHGTISGPVLMDDCWYEFKIAWGADRVLRLWYREPGREKWLPDNDGYAVFGSGQTYPELLRIGHRDVGCPATYQDVDMHLYADYWRQVPDVLREIGHLCDEFDWAPIDPCNWEIRDRDYSPNYGSIYPDGQGRLRVSNSLRDQAAFMAQSWIESKKRLPNEPWTYYSEARFGASGSGYGLNRTDGSLGYRFSIVNGKEAWVEFDSYGTGCRLKYGNSDRPDAHGVYWSQWWPMELKFGWDGSQLCVWYRKSGNGTWLGPLIVYGSTTGWPELVKIGQPGVKYVSTYEDVDHNLDVYYWCHDREPNSDPEAEVCDDFEIAEIDPCTWGAYETDFGGNNGSIINPGGYLQFQTNLIDEGSPRWTGWVWSKNRIPAGKWMATTGVKFSASASGRTDIDLGVHFDLADGRTASAVFDSYDSMRLKYGLLGSLTAGARLTPGVWHELEFIWDGQDLYLSLCDQGQMYCYTLLSDPNARPERVRLGQVDWRYPNTYQDVSASFYVDDFCLESGKECFSAGMIDACGHVVTQAEYDRWVSLGRPICWCYPCHCRCDANGDCTINAVDVLALRAAWPGFPNTAYNPCVDTNYDGVINAVDVLALRRAWPGLDGTGCSADCQ
jgi:hypothetical protein